MPSAAGSAGWRSALRLAAAAAAGAATVDAIVSYRRYARWCKRYPTVAVPADSLFARTAAAAGNAQGCAVCARVQANLEKRHLQKALDKLEKAIAPPEVAEAYEAASSSFGDERLLRCTLPDAAPVPLWIGASVREEGEARCSPPSPSPSSTEAQTSQSPASVGAALFGPPGRAAHLLDGIHGAEEDRRRSSGLCAEDEGGCCRRRGVTNTGSGIAAGRVFACVFAGDVVLCFAGMPAVRIH